jgi:hypothetical protein
VGRASPEVRSGWIPVGELSDGETKNWTFVWWLDRAETGTAALERAMATSSRSITGLDPPPAALELDYALLIRAM